MKVPFIYGTAWKKEKTKSLVTLALSQGFVAIDTANQLKHYDESQVGDAVKEFLDQGHNRNQIFLQTKFTPRDGQDHRLPYDENAPIAQQVSQSFLKSLEHLKTDYVDSYLLHGPYHYPQLGEEDWEAWKAIEKIYQEGRAKIIGVSNFNHLQLEALIKNATIVPQVVQNRCFAQTGWDFHVRKLCHSHQIMYQPFSLLTANPFVMEFPQVLEMAKKYQATPAQIVFAFALQSGMVPLTGTSDKNHMEQDLRASNISLSAEELKFILSCALKDE